MQNQYQRIVPFIVFTLALILLFILVRPMITILLASTLLAYVSFPIARSLQKKIRSKALSIILALAFIVIIILIPITFLAFEIAQEGQIFYHSLSGKMTKGILFGFGCSSTQSQICALVNRVEKVNVELFSAFSLDLQLQKLLILLNAKLLNFLLQLPIILAALFLTVVLAYFITKDWQSIVLKVTELLPMREKTIQQLTTEFGNITHTVIYAQLFVAGVQGILATIGFYVAGIPFPIIMGVVAAFCALIPTIGTAIIWLPASLFLILSGYSTGNAIVLAKGIALFFYGLFVISLIDNILLAKIIHVQTKVSQIIVIVGVIGGVSVFGVAGIFIGPILLPLLITYFQTFKERFV